MRRRRFLRLSAGAWMAAAGSALAGHRQPRIAITIDDFNLADTPLMTGAARNRALLATLDRFGLKAGAFPAGKFIDNAAARPLVRAWADAGHLIGNHTYGHGYYPSVGLEAFAADVLTQEAVVKGYATFVKLLRFPYLAEGTDAPSRDALRAFLAEHGYRDAHVTIDTSDWYVNTRMRERLKQDPGARTAPYRDYLLEHVWARAGFYDGLARELGLGEPIHTILLHHTDLNALFLGDLIAMFRERGWGLADASQAFAQALFRRQPRAVPAGQSLIWALAKETGRFEDRLRFPGEDGDYEKPLMDARGL